MYGISVAAEIVGTGIQNLRLYERRGLVKPGRSAGGTRLYSADDIARLNRILNLLADGLNLAGVAMVLDLQDDNTRMRHEISIRPRAAKRQADHRSLARSVRSCGPGRGWQAYSVPSPSTARCQQSFAGCGQGLGAILGARQGDYTHKSANIVGCDSPGDALDC